MLLARLGIEEDCEAVIELARMQVAETLPHMTFSADKARETYRQYLETSAPTVFVVEDSREIVGYLMALTHEYAFTDGHYVNQEVLYVRPDKRGTRAAAHLTKLFNSWADRINATEVYMGVANGFKMERTTKFFQHFGFEIVGSHLRRIRGAA